MLNGRTSELPHRSSEISDQKKIIQKVQKFRIVYGKNTQKCREDHIGPPEAPDKNFAAYDRILDMVVWSERCLRGTSLQYSSVLV